jgi:hypothetical protein
MYMFGPEMLGESSGMSPHYRDAIYPSVVHRTSHRVILMKERLHFIMLWLGYC